MSGFEIAGLVFGVAGLYGSCIDAATRIQAYNSFKTDSQALDAQFNAERLRLEIWGDHVGLKHLIHQEKQPDLPLDQTIHKALQNARILEAVEDLLLVIENICLANDDTPKKPARTNSGLTGVGPNNNSHGFEGVSKRSRRRKLAWAFGGKEERTTQIKLFCELVQQLHNLVPVRDGIDEHASEDHEEDHDPGTLVNADGSAHQGTSNPWSTGSLGRYHQTDCIDFTANILQMGLGRPWVCLKKPGGS